MRSGTRGLILATALPGSLWNLYQIILPLARISELPCRFRFRCCGCSFCQPSSPTHPGGRRFYVLSNGPLKHSALFLFILFNKAAAVPASKSSLFPDTHIISTSLHTGVFPSAFKQAHITPLLKKPTLNPTLLENYRPFFSSFHYKNI